MPRLNQQFEDPFLPVRKERLFTSDNKPTSRYAVMLHDGEKEIEVGHVSEGYQLVPNDTVNQIALDVLARSELQFGDGGLLFDGRKYRQRWILPELSVEPQQGDIVRIALDIINSYDGSTTFGMAFNAQRLVCSNGMVIDYLLGGFRFRHFSNDGFAQELNDAVASIHRLSGQLEPLSTKLRLLIDQPADRSFIQDVFSDLRLPLRLQAQIYMGIAEDNAWGVYNACTGVLTKQNTHRADNINRQVSRYLISAVN